MILLTLVVLVVPLTQAKTEMIEHPCDGTFNANIPGDNRLQGESEFHYGEGFKFTPEIKEIFEQKGYLVMREIVKRQDALHYWKRHWAEVNHSEITKYPPSQPQRFKVRVVGNRLKDANKILGPAYFIAHQLLNYVHPINFNNSVDWMGKIRSDNGFRVHMHNNAALPGSVWQNPHWDVLNAKSNGMILIDIPMIDVDEITAPLEIWEGTNRVSYDDIFEGPLEAIEKSNTMRQYWGCLPELQQWVAKRSSARVQSSLGDAVIRNPATIHRGTPNKSGQVRDMITVLIQPPKGKK